MILTSGLLLQSPPDVNNTQYVSASILSSSKSSGLSASKESRAAQGKDPATTVPPSTSLPQPVSGTSDSNRRKSSIQEIEEKDRRAERAMEGSSSVRQERNHVLAPQDHENRLNNSDNAKPKPTTSHEQGSPQYPRTPSESSLQRMHPSYRSRGSVPYLPDANDSRGGLSSRHSAEQPTATISSIYKYHPQLTKTSLSLRYASHVYLGAPEPQDEPSSGSSYSEECVEPDPVQSIIKQHTEGVMSSSPEFDADISRFGNALDAHVPAQPPIATSISLRAYLIIRLYLNIGLTAPGADTGHSQQMKGRINKGLGTGT